MHYCSFVIIPCILLALQIINILVHSRIYFRCQNNFYLAAFNILLFWPPLFLIFFVCATLYVLMCIYFSVSLS